MSDATARRLLTFTIGAGVGNSLFWMGDPRALTPLLIVCGVIACEIVWRAWHYKGGDRA